MRMDFNGRVVLITGSASGLGKTIAQAFLEKGAKVGICDVDVEKGKETLEIFKDKFGDENVLFCKCDVTKDEDFEGVYDECEKRLGTLDILVNNAGIYAETDWKKTMDINYGGVVRGSELAMKKMGKHNGGKGGHVINIASIAGVSQFYLCPFYAGSKAAIVHYTRCVGHEFHYNYSGVSFQSLCPSGIQTKFLKLAVESYYTPQSFKKQMELKGFLNSTTQEVTETLFELLKDNKPGSVMVVEKGVKPYYTSPSVLKDY